MPTKYTPLKPTHDLAEDNSQLLARNNSPTSERSSKGHRDQNAIKQRFWLLVLIVSLMLNQPACAWNHFGHMTVACVCYEKLTPPVKRRVNELVKLNPLYSDWVQQVSQTQEDKDEQLFMLAATWPDLIKQRPGYTNDAPGSPESYNNIGYADKNMHRSWHFVYYPYSQDHTPLPALPTPNAETQIAKFQQVLSSPAADDLKSYDLCYLVHIVGDVHEPLHCITRVTKSSPKGDGGGHDVQLTDSAKELHNYWDSALGPNAPPATAIPLAKSLGKANTRLAAVSDVHQWTSESHKIAIDNIYQKPIGPGNGPYSLTDRYKRMTTKITREGAELAGERLANWLNQNLK